jgi:hypothetical protein
MKMSDAQKIELFLKTVGATKCPTRRTANSMSFPISKGRGSVWNSTRTKAIAQHALDSKASYA